MPMEVLSSRMISSAQGTVELALGRLFPDMPPDDPAMGAMILNMCANALGLGNAAIPFSIRAMQELVKLNTMPGMARNKGVSTL
ncbi:hypothetical protein LH51_17400 [Nitrincola sp. A-D6]|uniref:hypothetical protein n=1 Tax=Nitrincola sp. A-D6 TaxID=1545442 RepID=UPI00051FEEE7|nr:hypothetical protein [Nitrincola sp. A-D6]KGK41052.1 hypothetical protein LH51_17400 [Nitrincola sp. A-D6]